MPKIFCRKIWNILRRWFTIFHCWAMPDQFVTSSTALTMMPECSCRAEAVDSRWKCRCRANFPSGIATFRHLYMIFLHHLSSITPTAAEGMTDCLASFQTGFGITKSPMPEPFRYRNAPMPVWDAVRKYSDARLCHFRCPAIPFSERKFRETL